MRDDQLNKSAIQLTRELLAVNTINPPGREIECAKLVGKQLQEAGFAIDFYEFDRNRTSLVAVLPGNGDHLPICFSGHFDTVPLGATSWRVDPFCGETGEGKLYGRGSSDMKSGVSAMVISAMKLARQTNRKAGIVLILTAGEETGCVGAGHLAKLPGVLPMAGAIVIGEPTSNYPLLGHKGALWLNARARGVTAHGAMPEMGDNAINKVARAVTSIGEFHFESDHPLLGKPTANVGRIAGGESINSVPDHAEFTIDIRTVESGDNLLNSIRSSLGPEIELSILQQTNPIATDPGDEWVGRVYEIMAGIRGENPEPRTAPYFTDAGFLTPVMGQPPTIILGPGEDDQLHKTDEYCLISRIEEAVEIYYRIGEDWVM